jgi:prepilin-type processing-associated H-X9-DG protein
MTAAAIRLAGRSRLSRRQPIGPEDIAMAGSDGMATKRDIVVVLGVAMFALVNLAAVGTGGRERAKRMVCLGNLRQLSLAWLMYALDNDGRIVNGATGFSDQNMPWGDHRGELAWVHAYSADWELTIKGIENGALWPYLRDARIYRCPTGPPGQALTYSIAFPMNGVLHQAEFDSSPIDKSWHGKFVKSTAEIETPSLRLVFVDERAVTPDAFAVYYSRQWWWDLPPVQHSNGGTFSFADGHVEHWQWKSPETVTIGRSGSPGQNVNTCHSCDACDDLYKLQMAVWGKLGYEPSCGESAEPKMRPKPN